MVKLSPVAAPEELTDQLVADLTGQFLATGEHVWDKPYIRTALMTMSGGKCCYCECKVDEESKYMEVEHYKPKGIYQDQVVVWSNLLPSCKHCNGHKNELDTQLEPIINPSVDVPQEYLRLVNYRLQPRLENKTARPFNFKVAEDTIGQLDLNNRQRLTDVRYRIGEAIQKELCDLNDLIQDLPMLTGGSRTRRKNNILGTLKNLLVECQPDSEFSATAATVLLNDMYYSHVKGMLEHLEFWTHELQALEDIAWNASLH